MAKLEVIMKDDGTIAARIEKGIGYEEAREKIFERLQALRAEGIEIELESQALFDAIEQHRHDGDEERVLRHQEHLHYHRH